MKSNQIKSNQIFLMIADPTSMFQEAGLNLGFAIFVVSHIDKNSIHPKREHSNQNEVELKHCYCSGLRNEGPNAPQSTDCGGYLSALFFDVIGP